MSIPSSVPAGLLLYYSLTDISLLVKDYHRW